MQQITRVLLVVPAFALAACATSPTVTSFGQPGPSTLLAPADQMTLEQPAQTISNAAAITDASAFVDATAYSQLGARSKAEVADAQFKALQFGRVGAPRTWQGDKGQSGSILVGPYVRVNLIDCRDFTNTVAIGSQTFVKKGTACREADGSWTVSAVKVG
jgi:surface antigen